ncbi:MAG TPA: ferredoxin-thioredoxin reductase catalytic domain-containing protein [Rectinemataceae bacterium]
MKEKNLEDTRLFASMVAEKQGWVLNPDQEFLGDLLEGLKANYNRYGYFLCPCRDTEGNREEDKEAICPCVWSRKDIPEFGHCYCALYLSRDFALSGTPPSAIPDRRYSEEKAE